MSEKDENIENLASQANEIMAENKYYYNKLSLYDKFINITKEVIKNIFSNKSVEKSIECFNKYIEDIQKQYDILNKSYEKKELPEYNDLIDNLFSEITMGKPILEQRRTTQFYLDYIKKEKDSTIKSLKESIKKSKQFQLFREPKRFSLIEMKEGAKEIEKTTTELQQNMLYELKKCNKFKERIIKYNEQIHEIENNIDILKNCMKPKEDKLNGIKNIKDENDEEINVNQMDLKKSHNFMLYNTLGFKNINKNFEEDNKSEPGSDDRRKKRKKNKNINKLITEFKKVEDLFEISDVELEKENLIDDDLNSDDEATFGTKINQPIKLIEYHKDEIEKSVPAINLSQIEYNKMKIVKEEDLYSFQRRKYKSQNIDNLIKDEKRNKEKLQQKLELLKKKEKLMNEFITEFKKKYIELKKFNRRNTTVHNQKTNFIKKSIFGEGDIEEELSEGDDNDEFGSDYENEQNEIEDFAIIGKQSVNVGVTDFSKKNEIKKGNLGGKLGKSVIDGLFKNKLRNKLKKERAKSK